MPGCGSTTCGAATAGLAVSTVDTVAARAAGESAYRGWFENASHYDGTIDETGPTAGK